jgi:reactive intermediate/imine deaminase
MKEIINAAGAPAAIGTYSQAVRIDNTIYFSGQIGMDPETTALVSDDFVEQAHRVFKNLKAVAHADGAGLNDFVKLNVYVTDLGNFSKLNDVMAEYFRDPYPARAAIEVSALPKGALIEIDGVLVLSR